MKTTTMRTTSVLCLALALLVGIPTLAQAAIQVGSTFTFANGSGANGGIFHAREVVSSLTFDTFCTETGIQQYINFSDPFEVVALGLSTSGNVSAEHPTFVSRTLTPYVAWAYHEFLNQGRDSNGVGTGGLYGFVHGTPGGNSAAGTLETRSANSLQELIWGGLGYTGFSTSGGILDSAITDQWLTNYNASSWTGTGEVQIMQLINARTGATAQDMLVEMPGGGGQYPVPEANSFATWSLLLFTAVMGLSYRRQ